MFGVTLRIRLIVIFVTQTNKSTSLNFISFYFYTKVACLKGEIRDFSRSKQDGKFAVVKALALLKQFNELFHEHFPTSKDCLSSSFMQNLDLQRKNHNVGKGTIRLPPDPHYHFKIRKNS
jgi:hypothetical protein